MLGLYYKTPQSWAYKALEEPESFMLDHYFCELKAAANAERTAKIHGSQYPKLEPLMKTLADEEYRHADQVIQLMQERGWNTKARIYRNPYVKKLRKLACGNFLDMLIVCSLVEARSAERFRLLAQAARGSGFAAFYEDLYASEVNHYLLFQELAVDFFGEEKTRLRSEELFKAEAAIMQAMPPGPWMHSGTGDGERVLPSSLRSSEI